MVCWRLGLRFDSHFRDLREIGSVADPTPPEVTHRPDTGTPAGNPSRRTGGVIEGDLRPARPVHPGEFG